MQGERRGAFSPRVDYEEWTPLGRGDPLKNDPTYDYLPPVLERVNYWMNPSSRTPDPPPPDALQEVPSPTQPEGADSRRDVFDPFLKFVDGPKIGSSSGGQQQSFNNHRPPSSSKSSPPSLTNQFYQSPYHSLYKHHHPHSTNNVPADVQWSLYETSVSPPEMQIIRHHSSVKYQQRPPYTVLVPPPLPSPDPVNPPHSIPSSSSATGTAPIPLPDSGLYPALSFGPDPAPYTSTLSTSSSDQSFVLNLAPSSESTLANKPSNNISTYPTTIYPPAYTYGSAPPNLTPIPQINSTPNSTSYSEPKPAFNSESTSTSGSESNISTNPALISSPYFTSISEPSLVSITPLDSTNTPPSYTALISSDDYVAHPAQNISSNSFPSPVNNPTPYPSSNHLSNDMPYPTSDPAPNPELEPSLNSTSRLTPNPGPISAGHSPYNQDKLPLPTQTKVPAVVEDNSTSTGPEFISEEPLRSTSNSSLEAQHSRLVFQSSPSPNWPEAQIHQATLPQTSSHVTWRTPPITPSLEVDPQRDRPPAPPSPLSAPDTRNWNSTRTPIKEADWDYSPNYQTFASNYHQDNVRNPLLQSLLQDERVDRRPWEAQVTTASTPSVITTSTVASLTTDPLFSHYKQPMGLVRGPMYLIIQGHSKVKTYGANKKRTSSFHGIPIQDNNEITQGNDRSGKTLHLREKDVDAKDGNNVPERDSQRGAFSEIFDKDPDPAPPDEAQERKKRQSGLEELLPIDDDDVEEILNDFLVQQSQGSGVGAIIASAIVNDS
uniref:Uncharacterized protein n=1 Tax=Timema douglasi TaxID=61478 RepID=A0A7R8ZDR0_TIMDO|nr:unnamed protein product [Timema douglasi]